MRVYLTLIVLAALCGAGLAGEISVGATLPVKPYSIWFEEESQLARWQEVKKRGNDAVLKAYQKGATARREAWQFINPLTVRVLGFDRQRNRVHVQMTTEGRLQGSDWFVDAEALKP
jgi:hypothetical protein